MEESTHRLFIMMIYSIEHNIKQVRKRILRACRSAGRNMDSVTGVLATKTVPPACILEAASFGYMFVAENRVQEAEENTEAIGDHWQELDWHFIGHLQSRKGKQGAAICLDGSIDRLDENCVQKYIAVSRKKIKLWTC